ncbi:MULTISPECIES: hypothetical protein [unclassified Polaribacter]|uniref:hypothetical protein n=1 Tax=unclassified Polaribacter TaxID=196858 RepID=UPI0011BF7E4B|nr:MULTISPECIES: hypothetical protein [unclassified Polaribacter]TXD53063.1 hypothetical protein ES043_05890 [Polaribacter sp. IC063]TXD59012.1 hypothetical protein ES044_10825 [Polaribacter sp. IC066]
MLFEIPEIKITIPIGGSGNNFFGDPSISIPKLTLNTYKTGSIDFYGGVLYKNVWYGVRMVSNDFKKK